MTPTWPAEWWDHRETVIIWPGRPAVWDPYLEEARQEFQEVVLRISDVEPVRVVVSPGMEHPLAGLRSRYNVTHTELLTDDAWARDTAPFFVQMPNGIEAAVSFGFNSWGGRYVPFDEDAAFGERLCSFLGIPWTLDALVLEGGAVDVDGCGTALVVESSVLATNRNPTATKADFEGTLFHHLGVSHVIWLPHGLVDDLDTDGHVDNVARFVAPGTVVCQARGRDREDSERLAYNSRILATARDARGSQLEIVEVPWLPYGTMAHGRPASYCNFYIVNDAVLVPVTGAKSDEEAVTLIGEAVQRAPVPVRASALAYGGGGVHCIAMPRFR